MKRRQYAEYYPPRKRRKPSALAAARALAALLRKHGLKIVRAKP